MAYSAAVCAMIDYITEELSPVDVEARYCEFLDEMYSFRSVGGPFEYLLPSKVLEEMSPTDFRCGVADFTDSEDLYEIGGDYYDRQAVDNCREEYISNLECELSDAESDSETEYGEHTEGSLEALRRVDELTAEISQCNKHVF